MRHLRHRLRLAALLGAVGCGGAGPAELPATTDTGVVTPSPYDPGLDAAGEATPLTTAELEEGLAEVLAYTIRQDPIIHHDAWTTMFWGNVEDGVCPTIGEHNGQDYFNDDCTTSAGAVYNGWALNFRRGGWWDGEMTVRQYNWLSGHAYIIAPDGSLLQSFGDLELLIGDAETYDQYSGFVFGDFSWDDPSVAGTWIQEPVSGELYFEFKDYGSWQSMAYDGGLTYFSGPVLAARFADVAMDDAPGSCAKEPTGTMRLRDRAGLWVDVVFGSDGADDPACDGCGDASFEGTDLGPVCADWTPFVTWAGWPWSD